MRKLRLAGVVIPFLLVPLVRTPLPGPGNPATPVAGHGIVGGDAVADPTLLPLRASEVGGGLPFRAEEAPFRLTVGGELAPFKVFFAAVVPGQTLRLGIGPEGERPILTFGAGEVLAEDDLGWSWRAPSEPGPYALRLHRGSAQESIRLNVFVLRPASETDGEVLNGYRIGAYESRPLRGDSIYLPPQGFIEVSSREEDILVSPHFTVGQFLCKQPGDPKYLVLSRYLVVKLEAILKGANDSGYAAPTLFVMSGFRTPWYNRSIGNRTVYSRHLWGGAADVYLDVDGNGAMDDLNRDGRSDIADVRILFDIAERVDASGYPGTRPGGLSAYRKNSVRGPFIHVDARGQSARW